MSAKFDIGTTTGNQAAENAGEQENEVPPQTILALCSQRQDRVAPPSAVA
jgi:hypothetical protein